VDQTFQQAITAGGKEVMPVANMFWGDRFGSFTDPFGHVWSVMTHVEDVKPEDIDKRAQAFYAQQAQRKSA
jgi:PhnB protein